jgi:hydrogenase maturation protease
MLILCCGNPDRGDDGAGPLVARRLHALEVEARVCGGEALSLMEAWRGQDDVIVVDAVVTGAPLGTVSVWDASTAELAPRWFRCSTHALGVAEAVGMARMLGRLPKRLRIWGIEARRFEPGAPPDPAVARAANQAAERIARENKGLCTSLP